MFILVLQNDPNWHTLDRLPVPYAIDRKKLANIGASLRRPFAGLGRVTGKPTPGNAVLDESRGLLAGRIIHWKTDYQQHIFAGWHERNTNPC